MRVRSVLFIVCLFAGVASLAVGAAAQSAGQGAAKPAQGAAQQPAGRGAAAPAAGATQMIHGNLLQVMRGILLPASNVVFFAQSEDPAALKPAEQAATSPNLLTSVYGGWTAVENSSIALAEAANLLTIPGRRCSNGRPAPIDNADWKAAVQALRDAGMASLKAAQAKNQDQIVDVSEKITNACAMCHDVYRETEDRGGLPARCTVPPKTP
jgi:hypothetical protein